MGVIRKACARFVGVVLQAVTPVQRSAPVSVNTVDFRTFVPEGYPTRKSVLQASKMGSAGLAKFSDFWDISTSPDSSIIPLIFPM